MTTRRRGDDACTTNAELREPCAEDGVTSNDEIATAIRKKLSETNYDGILSSHGITTVGLDENGEIAEFRPDGSRCH